MKKAPSTRISLYSQRCEQKHCASGHPIEHFAAQVRTAAQRAYEHASDLLVLPGYSLGNRIEYAEKLADGAKNTRYSLEAIDEGLSMLQSITNDSRVSVLAEVDHTYLFQPSKSVQGPYVQTMAQGSDSHSIKRRILNMFTEGKRDITINNIRCRIMLCGENNVLTVKKNNSLRLPDNSEWDWDYNVILNPGHTSMRRWRELLPRFNLWSQDGRYVLFTVNNLRGSWGSALRVFHNGVLKINGDLQAGDYPAVHIEDRWRMVTVQV